MRGLNRRDMKEAEKLSFPHTMRWTRSKKSSNDCLGNLTTCFYSTTGVNEVSGYVRDTTLMETKQTVSCLSYTVVSG